jgi:hypothetical protein
MQSNRLLRNVSALLFCLALTPLWAQTNTSPHPSTGERSRALFDGRTPAGWRGYKQQTFPTNGWVIEDGWLHCLGKSAKNGGGDIVTVKEYQDFDLQWEWKQAPGGNSGVKYFITEDRKSATGHEYQMIDNERHADAQRADGKRATAAFYDVLKPAVPTPTKPAGETNHSRILAKGNHVEHWLNGVKVLEYECDSDEVKAAVANSKFKSVPGFSDHIRGHILLQDHDTEVWFRNIRIQEVD